MKKEELIKIIEQGENEIIELKEAKSDFDYKKLGKYFSALSNEARLNHKREAYLILGVDDDKSIVGTCYQINKYKQAIRDECNIGFLSIEEFDFDNKKVLCLRIPASLEGIPTPFKKHYYERNGDSLSGLSLQKIETLRNTLHQSIELKIIKENLTLYEVLELLDINLLIKSDDENEVRKSLIEKNIIIEQGKFLAITFLGAICFAKNLNNFNLDDKRIRFIHYQGKSKLDDVIKDFLEDKGYFIAFEELIRFLADRIPINEVIKDGIRKDILLFPEAIYRELIANALIHQDFNLMGINPKIELFENRLEITNLGKPLIDPSRFIDLEQTRNKYLFNIARKIGIGEERGQGIDRIIYQCEMFQLPAPSFIKEEDRMKVILYAPKTFEEMTMEDRIRACWQHCYLIYVVDNKAMTNSSLRNRFKLDDTKNISVQISKILNLAVKQEKIKKKGGQNYIPFWA